MDGLSDEEYEQFKLVAAAIQEVFARFPKDQDFVAAAAIAAATRAAFDDDQDADYLRNILDVTIAQVANDAGVCTDCWLIHEGEDPPAKKEYLN